MREVRDCDTVEFFPYSIPFPRVTLNDHLKQAATNIISILSNPPSTTVPSLLAGEDTNQALYEIAKLLGRVDNIPEYSVKDQGNNILAPRVVNKFETKTSAPTNVPTDKIPYEDGEIDMTSPQYDHQNIITASNIQHHSNKPKNLYFQNEGIHKYNLRSNPSPPYLIQHLSSTTSQIYHIYRSNSRKESINSLLKGTNSAT